MKHYLIPFLMLLSTRILCQEVSVSGYVTTNDTVPVAGAAVVLKGTTIGTVTDKNGFFRINKVMPGTFTIRISFVGYETQEKTITVTGKQNKFSFVLKDSGIDLNEVVVTGTRSEKTLKNVPVLTQVINARKMIDLGISTVTDALQNNVPGLNVSQFGTRISVTMQGMDSKYVLFLVDGERIAGEISGDIDYSLLSLENIDHIEIIKGASSSLYGSNAIGGVINIITKKITGPFDAKLYSRYSAFNELYSGATAAVSKGVFGTRTSINYNMTDGYDNTPESPHDWTQNPYSSFKVNQKFQITPSSRLSLTPYFGFYEFERGNVTARPAHDLYRDLNAGIKGQYYIGNHSIDMSYYRDRYNTYSVLELMNNSREFVSYDIIQTVRAQGNIHLSEKNNLVTGLEYNSEDLFSLRIEGEKKKMGEIVFYGQEDLAFGEKWNIISGLRISNHSNYGFNFSPKISVLFREGAFNFRTSAGTGFRSPSLKELYMNFDHFGEWYIIGNNRLKPESSVYFSASTEFSKSWNNSSLTLYNNRLTDMISDRWLSGTEQLTRQYQNIASATVYGFDIISKQKIGYCIWLSAGYSYVKSRDNETRLQLYGTVKNSGNIAADYTFRKKYYSLNAQITCRLMGEKFYEITADGPSYDKPYSSWRLTISQEYKWFRISVGTDNIFNVVKPQNLDFISPGRRYFTGINIDFGKIKLK